MADPYEVLGVDKHASAEDIQKAYRGLAKKLHPDLNPGDKDAESRFKEVTAAYDIVGDAEKRSRFDRGEIDASGAERPRQRYYREYAGADGGASNPYASDAGFADFGEDSEASDILSELFRRAQARPRRGQDVRYRLAVDFLDAVNGAKPTLTLGDGTTIDLTVPPGLRDGQVLRLRGKGLVGSQGGEPGDALIEIEVRPHPTFTRKGDDIHLDLPITLPEAVLGGKVRAPTPTGPVTLTIPKGANTGRVLRLKGKGAGRPGGGRGDEYVTLKVVLPTEPDDELREFVARWGPEHPYNPRQSMET